MDMSAVWVAEHGWCYLKAIIDCLTREIVGWGLEPAVARSRRVLVDRGVSEQGIPPAALTLGTDNGSAFTARRFRALLSAIGIRHRRGGYHDPESQAFIESWFAKLKERCVWRQEFETLEQTREVIAAYVDTYHRRPDSGLDYRTSKKVRKT